MEPRTSDWSEAAGVPKGSLSNPPICRKHVAAGDCDAGWIAVAGRCAASSKAHAATLRLQFACNPGPLCGQRFVAQDNGLRCYLISGRSGFLGQAGYAGGFAPVNAVCNVAYSFRRRCVRRPFDALPPRRSTKHLNWPASDMPNWASMPSEPSRCCGKSPSRCIVGRPMTSADSKTRWA